MSETTTTAPKPVSEKQLRANRLNCLKSTGPSIEGRKRSCRNNLIHGMRSSQMILPGESPEELAELREEIHDAVQPRDGVEKLLAERVVRARPGSSAAARASVQDDRADREGSTTRWSGPPIDAGAGGGGARGPGWREGPEAPRQLHLPAPGVAHLQDQWVDHSRKPLPALPVAGLAAAKVLEVWSARSGAGCPARGPARDPAGCGQPLGDVWPGGHPGGRRQSPGHPSPEWMQETEFVTRAAAIEEARCWCPNPRPSSSSEAYVAEVIEGTKGHREYVEDVADRNALLSTS